MSRISSNRRTAEVLRKTLKQLEEDATIDTQDPSFINLKTNLLQRILQLETDKARAEAVIHIVETPGETPASPAKKPDSGSRIA